MPARLSPRLADGFRPELSPWAFLPADEFATIGDVGLESPEPGSWARPESFTIDFDAEAAPGPYTITFSEHGFVEPYPFRVALDGASFGIGGTHSEIRNVGGQNVLWALPYLASEGSLSGLVMELSVRDALPASFSFDLNWQPQNPNARVQVHVMFVDGGQIVGGFDIGPQLQPGVHFVPVNIPPEFRGADGISISAWETGAGNIGNDVLWIDNVRLPFGINDSMPTLSLVPAGQPLSETAMNTGDAAEGVFAERWFSQSGTNLEDFYTLDVDARTIVTFQIVRPDNPALTQEVQITLEEAGTHTIRIAVPAGTVYMPYKVIITDVWSELTPEQEAEAMYRDLLQNLAEWTIGDFGDFLDTLANKLSQSPQFKVAWIENLSRLGRFGTAVDLGEAIYNWADAPSSERVRVGFHEFGPILVDVALAGIPILLGGTLVGAGMAVVAPAAALTLTLQAVLVTTPAREWLDGVLEQAYQGWLNVSGQGTIGEAIAEAMREAADDPYAPPVLDVEWYLNTYADAQGYVASGVFRSALDHYLNFGVYRGYALNADGDTIAVQDILPEYFSAQRTDTRAGLYQLDLGEMWGDTQSPREAQVLQQLLQQTGAALAPSAALFYLANRKAADLVHHGFLEVGVNGAITTIPDWSAGESFWEGAETYFGVNDVMALVQVRATGTAAEVVAEILARSDIETFVTMNGVHSIGIAEYGDTWVIFLGFGSGSGAVPVDNSAQTLFRYGTDAAEQFVAGGWLAVLDGGGGNDVLIGSLNGDLLIGGEGADSLRGGAGSDTASYRDDPGAVVVRLDQNWAQDGWGDIDQLVLIENSTGSSYNDVLIGNDGENRLDGSLGDDWVDGGAGDDFLYGGSGGINTLIGGAGTDLLTFTNVTAGVFVDLSVGAYAYAGGWDALTSIEGIEGSVYADTLFGDANANLMRGGNGADTLVGRGGHDTLMGEAGDDWIVGEDGNDVLEGGAGINVLIGGNGTDLASYASQITNLWVDMRAGVYSAAGVWDVFYQSIEGVRGGWGADSIFGNDADNTLQGAYGDDALIGNGGNDRIEGGAGQDWIVGGDGNDRLIGGEGVDVLTGGAGADVFDLGTAAGWDVAFDFNIAQDRFYLGGLQWLGFLTYDADGDGQSDDTLLGYAGGNFVALNVSGLTLAQWNALVDATGADIDADKALDDPDPEVLPDWASGGEGAKAADDPGPEIRPVSPGGDIAFDRHSFARDFAWNDGGRIIRGFHPNDPFVISPDDNWAPLVA